MPNWCFNKLTIIGDKENLIKFKDQAKGIKTDICLNNFVPMPKELEDTTSLWDKPNWYDWRILNWGTKWDVEAHLVNESENILIYESENILIYEFESAWSPPTYWLQKVALIFPELSFELYFKEPGMCFQGTMLAQGDFSIFQEEDYYEDIEEWEEYDEIVDKRHQQAMKDFNDMRFY